MFFNHGASVPLLELVVAFQGGGKGKAVVGKKLSLEFI